MKKKTTAFMIAAATVMLFLMGKASALVLLVALMYLLFQIADEEMDAACPKWDVVAYEVERMDLEQLFSALGDEEYCSYAFARLTGGEFRLSLEQEKKMLEALLLSSQGARILKDYVFQNDVDFRYWKHLMIEYAGLLTDKECSAVLDRFVEIFDVEEVK